MVEYPETIRNKLPKAIRTNNENLAHIHVWSIALIRLKVNSKKIQIIVIGRLKMILKIDWSRIPEILFDGMTVRFSGNVKNLGI